MTLSEFLRLDLDARVAYVWEYGQHITSDTGMPSNFYTLADFYVEIILRGGPARIVTAIPFREGERYERMVEHISLELV